MTVIGLTGNIGSGKTTVGRILEAQMGCICLNTDFIGRLVVKPGGEAYDELVACFGADYFLPDGELDRPKMAALVFGDKAALAKLNAITHPAVKRHLQRSIARLAADAPDVVVVVEAALLIEADYLDMLDELWLVWADDEVRLARVMQRDNATASQAQSRMDNQMPQNEKLKYARRVVHNNSDEENLRREVAAVWQDFCREYK